MPALAVAPRIHVLVARGAPIATLLIRVRSKLFHVVRWNTVTDELAPGSWFRGRIYGERCDVSFDGQWLVYFAMGSAHPGGTWTGIARSPWLGTFRSFRGSGTWFGGGVWLDAARLAIDVDGAELGHALAVDRDRPGPVPFELVSMRAEPIFGSGGVLAVRLARDGWRREGADGPASGSQPQHEWWSKPTTAHPTLRLRRSSTTNRLSFSLDELPSLLGDDVTWATWDFAGGLIVARAGRVERFAPADLEQGGASLIRDFRDLEPPEAAHRVTPADRPRASLATRLAAWLRDVRLVPRRST